MLKLFQVTNLTFRVGKHSDRASLATSLTHKPGFISGDDKRFVIEFILNIEDPENDFLINIQSSAFFEVDNPFDEEFKKSSFVRISAPAIAFPYLRAFVSNLTLNAGINPIILPSYNFVKMAEEVQGN